MSTAARPRLRGVVFDMDGTLTVPNIDFGRMYERCGVPRSQDLLTAVAQMPAEERAAAEAVIEEMEGEACRTLQLEPAATDCALWLHRQGIPTAMVTRNSDASVQHFHKRFWEPAGLPPFDPAVSRDTGFPPKPHPAALESIAKQWGVAPGPELLMVGDSPSNDVGFGKAAGVSTALVDSGRRFTEGGSDNGADVVVQSLLELPRLLWQRFEIGGPLGTGEPLIKYPEPQPGTPAAVAAKAGDVEALRQMTGGGELGATDECGNTPLIWAADAGQAEAVEFLLGAGVDANAKGYLGATAVSRACRRGHSAVLRALLGAPGGVDLNEPNKKMQSPLHFAAFKRNAEVVQLMLEAGASTTALDRKGRTPAEDTSDEAIRAAILRARSGA